MLLKDFVNRWLWVCPLLGIVIAAEIVRRFGLSLWTAILAALFLVCPALIAFGLWRTSRDR